MFKVNNKDTRTTPQMECFEHVIAGLVNGFKMCADTWVLVELPESLVLRSHISADV